MKKLYSAAMAVMSLFAFSAVGFSAGEIKLQLGHPEAEDNQHGIHQVIAKEFADRVAKYSNGRIKVEIYGNSQLGAERDLLEGMQMGTVDMASTANLIVGNFMPQYGVFDLPYMFKDATQAYKVLDSNYIAKLNEKFAQEKGIRILSFGSGGFRQIVSTKPVNSVNDIKGLKIRVPENDIYLGTFKALGANPTVMAWSELFTGLQQKTVEAFEIVAPVIYTSHFYEVCKYVGISNHFFSPDPFMISETRWKNLSAEDKEIVSRAAKEAAKVEREMVESYQSNVFSMLKDKGMTVVKLDVAPFQNMTKSVIDSAKGRIGADVIENVQKVLAQ